MSERAGVLTYSGVALGGSAGAALRVLSTSAESTGEFLSLLAINTLGCAAIGVVWSFSMPNRRRVLPACLSIMLMSGLCGALTSYSTAVILLIEHAGPWGPVKVLLLTAVSVGCWLVATLGGLSLGRFLNPVVPGDNFGSRRVVEPSRR